MKFNNILIFYNRESNKKWREILQKVQIAVILKIRIRLMLITSKFSLINDNNEKIKTLAEGLLFYLNKLILYFMNLFIYLFNF